MIEATVIVPNIIWSESPEDQALAFIIFIKEAKRLDIAVQSVLIEVGEPTKAKVVFGIGIKLPWNNIE